MIPNCDRLADWARTIVRGIFGDRVGVIVFLTGLLFLTLTWRVGFFINDNYTLANTYIAISNGHLDVRTIRYGPASGATPGMNIVGGEIYGRNYGQLITALPFLWLVKGLSVFTDIRIALLAFWSLTLLGLFVLVGQEIDRVVELRLVGSIAALGGFFGNLWFATNLTEHWYPILALQLATIVTAALTGVVLYRLLSEMYNGPVGASAGIATLAASPVAFWASIPKRHVLSTLLVVLTLYAFHQARVQQGTSATRAHAIAYASSAILAWVHAAEGALLFAALLIADLSTATFTQWSWRRYAYVVSAFGVALIPMLLTNYAIAGNPLEPPRMLPFYDGTPPLEELVGDTQQSTNGKSETSNTSVGSPSNANATPSLFTAIVATLTVALERATLLQKQLLEGIQSLADPERLYHVFIRSGWLGQTSVRNNSQTTTMTVLESFPLSGALAILPVAAATWFRNKTEWTRDFSATRATDVLAVAITAGFVLIYLPVLPLYAQITPRYLLPLFPLALYGVARQPAVRRALRESLLIWTYAAGVFIGGQLLLVWIVFSVNGLGEAVQFHAVLNLGGATLLALWISAEHILDLDLPRTGAFLLALCAAAGTLFVLFARIEYFEIGEGPVLPLLRWLAQRIELIH